MTTTDDDRVKAAELVEMFKVTSLLWSHQVWAFNGTQIACSCDHRFRTQPEHREHTAEALLPVLSEARAPYDRLTADLRALAARWDEMGDEVRLDWAAARLRAVWQHAEAER